MSVAYLLDTPVNVDPLGTPRVVSRLMMTGINFTTTPDLAPLGTGILKVTLTDPQTGFQTESVYKDAGVLEAWEAAFAPTVLATIFKKLAADGKLPAGSLAETTAITLTASTCSAVVDASVTLTAEILPAVSGSLIFLDGATEIGSAEIVEGRATLEAKFSTVGKRLITARFAGSAGFLESESDAVTVSVEAAMLEGTAGTVTVATSASE